MADDVNKEGVFDLSDAEGVNESERLLMQLCRRSFLSLWSYANLHTDEGLHGGSHAPKEFTDVLVVFGDDVILFSDKHIRYDEAADPAVAWGRWRKRAIDKSVKQLYGAVSWLRRYPDRIFLDPQCMRRPPVQLPAPERARYRLVAVTRGSACACARQFPGSLGTHRLNTGVQGIAGDIPFTVGGPAAGKPFVHVFDELALEIVMNEMDTVADFLRYLQARERFLSNQAMQVIAPGEEQLVSAYLMNMEGDNHYFLSDRDARPDILVVDETHYKGLLSRPEYQTKKRADIDSYFWDELIERFIETGGPRIVHPDSDQPPSETEIALRLMAGESRFRRRLLVSALKDLIAVAAQRPGTRRVRLFSTLQEPETCYVLLLAPKRDEESYQEYRAHRAAVLHAYCRCAKLRRPDGVQFIGLAMDHPVKNYPGSSEDLMVWTWTEFTPEVRQELERMRQELGILGERMTQAEAHADEFPAAGAKLAPGAKA